MSWQDRAWKNTDVTDHVRILPGWPICVRDSPQAYKHFIRPIFVWDVWESYTKCYVWGDVKKF